VLGEQAGAMADLPRWIDNPKVHSGAMLSAYLGYQKQCSDQAELADLRRLYKVDHKGIILGVDVQPEDVLTKHCKIPGCKRCETRQGGYQFRWYDKRWYAGYLSILQSLRVLDAWALE